MLFAAGRSLRRRRIQQAAREVTRARHHAECHEFLAGNAVIDEVPVERLLYEVESQVCELRFGVAA
jgi:hypothetical protein